MPKVGVPSMPTAPEMTKIPQVGAPEMPKIPEVSAPQIPKV